MHEVYVSFQISRKVFLVLSGSTIHAQKKRLFLKTLQTMHLLFLLHVRTDHDGGKQTDAKNIVGKGSDGARTTYTSLPL